MKEYRFVYPNGILSEANSSSDWFRSHAKDFPAGRIESRYVSEWRTVPDLLSGPRCEHGQYVACSVCRFDLR